MKTAVCTRKQWSVLMKREVEGEWYLFQVCLARIYPTWPCDSKRWMHLLSVQDYRKLTQCKVFRNLSRHEDDLEIYTQLSHLLSPAFFPKINMAITWGISSKPSSISQVLLVSLFRVTTVLTLKALGRRESLGWDYYKADIEYYKTKWNCYEKSLSWYFAW